MLSQSLLEASEQFSISSLSPVAEGRSVLGQVCQCCVMFPPIVFHVLSNVKEAVFIPFTSGIPLRLWYTLKCNSARISFPKKTVTFEQSCVGSLYPLEMFDLRPTAEMTNAQQGWAVAQAQCGCCCVKNLSVIRAVLLTYEHRIFEHLGEDG